ncbi:hypothetical protein HPB49_007942 [Dermacentor silvarum]|uniref:Uncharacterized protein n=1 Tax=Dermacentor silvarum TaxID=543639 RepID=A0ACB8DX99_DERSI|nr:hypothetical protein HPB49_007942 [Dermacentor silvarum]
MSSKYDEILTVIKRQDQDLKQLHKQDEQIEAKSNTTDIAELRATVDELERRGRCMKLEIHGLSKTDNEELLTKVTEVAKAIGVSELIPRRIGALHRFPTKKGREAGIIICFPSQSERDNWLSKRKTLTEKNSLFMAENVSNATRKLLFATTQASIRLAMSLQEQAQCLSRAGFPQQVIGSVLEGLLKEVNCRGPKSNGHMDSAR